MIKPVIMAGGTGSRLWPLSRELYPKQFLRLSTDNSMLQETLLRLTGMECDAPLVICNEKHRFLAAEQLRELNVESSTIILEPVGRNTAPAIAIAAISSLKKNEDPLLLVLAADHIISDVEKFHSAIRHAEELAIKGKLVTFGIVPKSPETGYGYIERTRQKISDDSYGVKKFIEKPNLERAKYYLEQGSYYWNSGMFLVRASKYIQELALFRPDILECCENAMSKVKLDVEQDFIRIDETSFINCPDESIDYAVMENTKDAVVVPLDAGWNDIGSWSALWEIKSKDQHNNVLIGDVYADMCSGSYIFSDDKLVTAIGLQDIIVVNTKDAVLISTKDQVQKVKEAVNYISESQRLEHKNHREEFRTWGKVDKIEIKDRYKINKITINVGEKITKQLHHHRAEHWVVLSGTALVKNDDKEFIMTENQSTFIPPGAIHILSNPGKIPVEILEIQSGSYLKDDDVIRFEP